MTEAFKVKNTMSMLVITNDFPPLGGGISVKAYYFVQEWAKLGEKIIVLTPVEGESTKYYERIVLPLRGHYLNQAYTISQVIKKLLRERNIDKLFCINWSPGGLGVLLSGVYRKVKWAVAVSGFDIIDAFSKPHIRFLARQVFKRTNKIFAPSGFLKEQVLKIGDFSKKTLAVSHGADFDKFNPDISGQIIREKYGLIKDTVILSACRLHPIKGIDIAIESLGILIKKFDNIKLLIVGSGPQEEELITKVSLLKLQGKVIFVGWVSHEELPAYYAACDIFIQPNRVYNNFQEGQSIAILEAMASGKPVISTPTGGIPEIESLLPYDRSLQMELYPGL